MILPRSSSFPSTFRAQACRKATTRIPSHSWRQFGRRFYASEHHGTTKKASSDLPWLIGSVVLTVPAATWLWQQNPKYSSQHNDHGHEKHNDHEQPEDSNQDQDQDQDEEDKREGKDEEKPGSNEEPKEDTGEEQVDGAESDDAAENTDKDERPIGEKIRNEPPNEISSSDNKRTSDDEGLKQGSDSALHKTSQQIKSVDADADDSGQSGPSQDFDKGHEGEERGTRVTEGDKKRKAEDPRSNSMHPYMADERKSKKSEGVAETAKITGTVDSSRKLR